MTDDPRAQRAAEKLDGAGLLSAAEGWRPLRIEKAAVTIAAEYAALLAAGDAMADGAAHLHVNGCMCRICEAAKAWRALRRT
jgi:hypothetical protein